MRTTLEKRVILALDVSERKQAMALVAQLAAHAAMFKIGLELFTLYGPEIVADVRAAGGRVMLDLKLHDIPNTVRRASANVARLGVDLLTIHAGGGSAMIRAAVEGVKECEQATGRPGPLVLAVTVLTSLDQTILANELGVARPLQKHVWHLAELARKAGAAGVVASPLEVENLRGICGDELLIVTPGIRPSGSPPDDQKRTQTPAEAVQAGADYLVIGRPVLQADDPVAVLEQMNREIAAHSLIR